MRRQQYPRRLLQLIATRFLPALVLAAMALQALAQADPPGRVARLGLKEGSVAWSPGGDPEWTDASLQRPLVAGDRLWTDKGSRAELHAGAIAVRMAGQSQLGMVAVDDHAVRVTVSHGAMQARLRELAEGERFEVETANLALRAMQPGEYRVDVDAGRGTTRVTVHSGTAMVYGENGQSLALGGGQQVVFRGRQLAQDNAQESPPLDAFDRWATERDRKEEQSISARYVPREVTGYHLLDSFGQWNKDASLGPVWFPSVVDASWAPYRAGRWDWVAPWGWTWLDNEPWAFATSHYGRWAQVGGRWGWVPGRMAARPVFAPALVAFIGGGADKPGDQAWSLRLGTGRPGVAWFPLAPGEAWRPGFRASPVYLGNVNRNMAAAEPANGAYAHRRPEAVTAAGLDDFRHGKPLRGTGAKLAMGELARAQASVTPPAPVAERAAATAARSPASAVPAFAAPAPAPSPLPAPVARAAAPPAPPVAEAKPTAPVVAPRPAQALAAPVQAPAPVAQPAKAAVAAAAAPRAVPADAQTALARAQAETKAALPAKAPVEAAAARAKAQAAQQAEVQARMAARAQAEAAAKAEAQAKQQAAQQAEAQAKAAAQARAKAQALQTAQREKAQRDKAQKEAKAAQAQRQAEQQKVVQRARAARERVQREAKAQAQKEAKAQAAAAQRQAQLLKEQAAREQARREAAEQAEAQARREAHVKRAVSLAQSDAQAQAEAERRRAQERQDAARREAQERERREAQEKAQAQRDARDKAEKEAAQKEAQLRAMRDARIEREAALVREQQAAAERWRREQESRRGQPQPAWGWR